MTQESSGQEDKLYAIRNVLIFLQRKVETIDFQDFLQSCIDQSAQAANHTQAVVASNLIKERSNELIELFMNSVVIIEEDIDLDSIDPERIRGDELKEEFGLYSTGIIPPLDSRIAEQRTLEEDAPLQPTIRI